MKKTLALVLSLLLAAAVLTGCAGITVVVGDCKCDPAQAVASETTAETAEVPAMESAVKTGIAIIPSISESTSATAEEAGAAKYDLTVAAVTVDADGVIASCAIDSVPATVNFDASGAVTTDLATAEIKTKNEQGADYGMVAWGGAIAEWDAQVAALCEYAVGKTVEELKTGAIDETGYAPEGADLRSSATIYLGGYVTAIEKAVNNARELGASAGDELTLVTTSSVGDSTSADAENAGSAQLYTTVMALTAKDGVISSCYIDAVQANVSFDATGAITTDLAGEIKTKNELGADYGMVAWGGAIAEWDAQAAAFARYVTGKTAEEVAGIAIDESAKPAEDTDLRSSVTISVGDFMGLVQKAMN